MKKEKQFLYSQTILSFLGTELNGEMKERRSDSMKPSVMLETGGAFVPSDNEGEEVLVWQDVTRQAFILLTRSVRDSEAQI